MINPSNLSGLACDSITIGVNVSYHGLDLLNELLHVKVHSRTYCLWDGRGNLLVPLLSVMVYFCFCFICCFLVLKLHIP